MNKGINLVSELQEFFKNQDSSKAVALITRIMNNLTIRRSVTRHSHLNPIFPAIIDSWYFATSGYPGSTQCDTMNDVMYRNFQYVILQKKLVAFLRVLVKNFGEKLGENISVDYPPDLIL